MCSYRSSWCCRGEVFGLRDGGKRFVGVRVGFVVGFEIGAVSVEFHAGVCAGVGVGVGFGIGPRVSV